MPKTLSIPATAPAWWQNAPADGPAPRRTMSIFKKIGDWERWPWAAFYAPLAPAWAWFCLRGRSPWFFSAANPTLTFGGFEGEGKREMYAQLPPGSFPRTVWLSPGEPLETIVQRIENEGIGYPFFVKPEVGMKGLLCRKIETPAQLAAHHDRCPVEYMAQELADFPMELGVFYHRHPASRRGAITGLTHKDPPAVTGDGRRTLLQLMRAHPRADFWLDEMARRHQPRLADVPAPGEEIALSTTANRNRGAHLCNLNHLIDNELNEVFDRLSLHGPGQFFYGRFDLKCRSLADLRRGKNFLLLEFNGAGAAPNHIYHAGLTLREAWAEMLRHWQILFEISRHNRQNGTRAWPFWKGLRYLRAAKHHFTILEAHDRQG